MLLERARRQGVFRRHVREGSLKAAQARTLHAMFLEDVRAGAWNLLPVTSELLEGLEAKLSKLRKRDLFLRAGDAVHLVTAAEAGFREVWTNDRHMLSAARSFGLKGRSV